MEDADGGAGYEMSDDELAAAAAEQEQEDQDLLALFDPGEGYVPHALLDDTPEPLEVKCYDLQSMLRNTVQSAVEHNMKVRPEAKKILKEIQSEQERVWKPGPDYELVRRGQDRKSVV